MGFERHQNRVIHLASQGGTQIGSLVDHLLGGDPALEVFAVAAQRRAGQQHVATGAGEEHDLAIGKALDLLRQQIVDGIATRHRAQDGRPDDHGNGDGVIEALAFTPDTGDTLTPEGRSDEGPLFERLAAASRQIGAGEDEPFIVGNDDEIASDALHHFLGGIEQGHAVVRRFLVGHDGPEDRTFGDDRVHQREFFQTLGLKVLVEASRRGQGLVERGLRQPACLLIGEEEEQPYEADHNQRRERKNLGLQTEPRPGPSTCHASSCRASRTC